MTEDLTKLFQSAYSDGLNDITKNEIKMPSLQISEEVADGVVSGPVVEEVTQPSPQQESADDLVDENDSLSETQPENSDEWLAGLEERAREKVMSLRDEFEAERRKYEEDRKKLENERRAAVGRAAYFQRREAELQKQKTTAPIPRQEVVPQIDDSELDALEKADPVLGKFIRSQNEAIKALSKQTVEQSSHLHHLEVQRSAQEQEYISGQTQLLYEAFPEWEMDTASDQYNTWLNGMDQMYPGFQKYARSVKHAYGDQNNLGAVDILNLFHTHVSEWQRHQEQQNANEHKAKQIEEERKKRQEQTPPEKKPVAVNPKSNQKDDLNKLFRDAYMSQVTELSGHQLI